MNFRKLFAVAICAITLGGSTLTAVPANLNAYEQDQTETSESYFTLKNAAYTTGAVVIAAAIINYLANYKAGKLLNTGNNYDYLRHI